MSTDDTVWSGQTDVNHLEVLWNEKLNLFIVHSSVQSWYTKNSYVHLGYKLSKYSIHVILLTLPYHKAHTPFYAEVTNTELDF
jgi:hypothetical protein